MDLNQEKIDLYISLLLKWNRVHKLTNYTDEKAIKDNILDSVYPVKYLNKNIKTVLDIGSGAGFPAIFLALAMPEVSFTLLEPLGKKFSFLNIVKLNLKLDNLRVLKSRVEELESEHFDLITSRAVTDTKSLIKLSKNLIDENTSLLLYKGENESDLDIPCQMINENGRFYIILEGKECLKY